MSSAKVIQLRPKRAPEFVCSACGADRGCDCNAPAIDRAAAAIAANPGKSDRAIAKAVGASPTTVGKARSQLSSGGQLDARTGLDGKTRRLPKREPEADDIPDDDSEAEQQADLLYHACLLVDRMAGATRRKFFAHIKRIYDEKAQKRNPRSGSKRFQNVGIALERRPAKKHRTRRKV
jgi:hypothetical protein